MIGCSVSYSFPHWCLSIDAENNSRLSLKIGLTPRWTWNFIGRRREIPLRSAFERSEVRLGDGSSVSFSGTFQLSECLLTQEAENRLFWLKHSLSAHLTSLLLAEVGAPEKDEEKDHCLLSSFNTRHERRTRMLLSQISDMSLLSPAVMSDQMKRIISKFYVFVKFRFWWFQLLFQHEHFIASCDWEILNVLCKKWARCRQGSHKCSLLS